MYIILELIIRGQRIINVLRLIIKFSLVKWTIGLHAKQEIWFILKDIDDCVNHGCVNGQCKDGINFYFCDCDGTGYEGKLCENGEVYTTFFIFI